MAAIPMTATELLPYDIWMLVFEALDDLVARQHMEASQFRALRRTCSLFDVLGRTLMLRTTKSLSYPSRSFPRVQLGLLCRYPQSRPDVRSLSLPNLLWGFSKEDEGVFIHLEMTLLQEPSLLNFNSDLRSAVLQGLHDRRLDAVEAVLFELCPNVRKVDVGLQADSRLAAEVLQRKQWIQLSQLSMFMDESTRAGLFFDWFGAQAYSKDTPTGRDHRLIQPMRGVTDYRLRFHYLDDDDLDTITKLFPDLRHLALECRRGWKFQIFPKNILLSLETYTSTLQTLELIGANAYTSRPEIEWITPLGDLSFFQTLTCLRIEEQVLFGSPYHQKPDNPVRLAHILPASLQSLAVLERMPSDMALSDCEQYLRHTKRECELITVNESFPSIQFVLLQRPVTDSPATLYQCYLDRSELHRSWSTGSLFVRLGYVPTERERKDVELFERFQGFYQDDMYGNGGGPRDPAEEDLEMRH